MLLRGRQSLEQLNEGVFPGKVSDPVEIRNTLLEIKNQPGSPYWTPYAVAHAHQDLLRIGKHPYHSDFINESNNHCMELSARQNIEAMYPAVDFRAHLGYIISNLAGPSAAMYGSAFYFSA